MIWRLVELWELTTIWGREFQFPEGKRVAGNLRIDINSVIMNDMRGIVFSILEPQRD